MKKKKVMILSISILLGILALIGASYALFSIVVKGEKTHTMKSAKLELSFIESSNGISLTNTYPVKDEDGMKTTSYTFTLKNTGSLVSSYDLSLEDQSITGDRMPDSVIKYYFKKDSIEQGPKLLTNRVLDTGYIYPNESITYELKVWMDYETGNEVQGMKFNTKVKAEGVQVGKPTDESCFNLDASTGTINKFICAPYVFDNAKYNAVANTNRVNDITDVVIPKTIGGVEVKKIGWQVFWGNQIKSVIIPNGITSIGTCAFMQNPLTNIVIPNSVTEIQNSAFMMNKFSTIEIPFGVTTLEDYAFASNQLVNITIPSSVTSIGNYAFSSNQLTSVTIPSSVTTINGYAFYKTSSSNPHLNIIYNETGKSFDWGSITGSGSNQSFITGTVTHSSGDIKILDGKPSDESCFYFDKSTGTITGIALDCEDVVIPEKIGGVTVTSIGPEAALRGEEYALTSVVIPNTVTSIGAGAFQGNKLTSVIIPEGVTTIGITAFWDNQLTNIIIPSSVTSMGYAAFNANQLPDSQAFIYARNSDGTENKTTLVSYGGAKKDNVVIPNTVTNIGDYSFAWVFDLKSVTIPSSVTSIGEGAFSTNQLTSVIIKGKANSSAFTSYPSDSPFGWASGYSDANITWNG